MSAFVRRERPPSASGVRSDSRGPQQQQQHGGGGSGGSARSAFAPAGAFDPHPPQPHYGQSPLSAPVVAARCLQCNGPTLKTASLTRPPFVIFAAQTIPCLHRSRAAATASAAVRSPARVEVAASRSVAHAARTGFRSHLKQCFAFFAHSLPLVPLRRSRCRLCQLPPAGNYAPPTNNEG